MPHEYTHEMKGIPLDDFRKFYEHSLSVQLWHGDLKSQKSSEFVWVMSQGNWFDAKDYMR